MESFILERIQQEVAINGNQYDGIKGLGTNHLLIETWHKILKCLDDPASAVSLLSIDFSKAFNRMSYSKRLDALKRERGP